MDHELLGRLERLEARLATVEAENAELRRRPTLSAAGPEVAAVPPPGASTPAGPEEGPSGSTVPIGRRRALRTGLAVAGAAAAGAVLLEGRPAAAANGDPLIMGGSNTSSSTTVLSGAPFYVTSTGTALYGLSTGAGAGAYVYGVSAHLTFGRDGTRTPPAGDTSPHEQGEVVLDKNGILWLCTVGGSPGSWRSLAGTGAAGAFYPFPTPRRSYDSRPGTTPPQTPKTKLVAGTTRRISLTNVLGATRVTGVLLNVLLVGAAAGNGNFTVWSADQALPQSNTLVWGGSAGRFSTLAFTAVDVAGRIDLRASLPTDVVIDVVGFYR